MKNEAKSEKGRRKSLMVISPRSKPQRFLRGMVTHDLVQRGLSFDDSYAVALAVRDHLSGREQVTTSELKDLIQSQLESLFGSSGKLNNLAGSAWTAPERFVLIHGERQPFSRGLLAKSIHAAGVDFDRAYRLVTSLEEGLRKEAITDIAREDLARRVGDLLEQSEGKGVAQRYRLVRRIQQLPRPLVIYAGGASGTGKSTLSLELAPLLRIYQVNSTDTIRQMMRMVFSPQILPALHTSSFEVAPLYGSEMAEDRSLSPHSPDFAARVTATFEEQATRVCVGVRAVVERAISENRNLLVEGVHLYPPLVPFPDLDGVAYQVPLILATTDHELHRSRFLSRIRGGRGAERYLRSFGAIRTIHDFLLQQAENHDIPLVETSTQQPTVTRTLRLITSLLQKKVPDLERPDWGVQRETLPTLLVFIDGLADRPVRALGLRTPLQAADTPTLDRLAKEGRCGLADAVSPGVVPDTAAGSLALFAQSPLALKRGPVEALGAGIELSTGDIALRGNFATLDKNQQVVDRRAGRIREETVQLAAALDRLPLPGSLADEVEIRVKAATEHRLAIVLRGDGLSSDIQGSDPGDGASPGPPLTPQPIDPKDSMAVETARILSLFEQRARRTLAKHPVNRARQAADLPPANTILTRGAGRIHRLIPLEQQGFPLRLACVSGDRTVLGLASWLGAKTITNSSMTANLDTDLKAKMDAALDALGDHDLVMVHLKGADIAAHDQRPDQKVTYLERLDLSLKRLLKRHEGPLRVAVASDHATLSESGQHSADPLPVLIWGEGIPADQAASYDEGAVAMGDLQRFPLQMLLGLLFDLG